MSVAMLNGVKADAVSLAFRRWAQPRVKVKGQFNSAVGVIGITSLKRVDPETISSADAKRAGFTSRVALIESLSLGRARVVYKIGLRYIGADPRLKLRTQAKLTKAELADLNKRLMRLDRASRSGPWTARILQLIGRYPARKAAELAALMKTETLPFKLNVRKLKAQGLTESLEVGYRLSPRGRTVLKLMQST